ncbi:inorganic phosphate transporter [Pseudokineococcus lusitanus]|uniref:PiT family inorganic phosphate transporter n=1 Tax=Pseudokineococcus lusitanus TaxID=763993 RepID=A0A3N1HK08_9ACTN|nr:inorganic phosphate transporter [Pseudokineococcus lusitanus]ROP42824.1 PiT family inorganic phosphate transporter [Pseudokineococcus lusitanus]
MTALLVAVVVLALAFAVSNGLHGAAGTTAAPVAVRALDPRAAALLAAVLVVLGGLLGGLWVTLAVPDVAVVPSGPEGLRVLVAALAGALVWNLVTFWRGLPTSTTQALFGGVAGAGLGSSTGGVRWDALLGAVVVPAFVVVVVVGGLSAATYLLLCRLAAAAMPARAHRRMRTATAVAAAATAVGSGVIDAQRTAAVVVTGLVAAGTVPGASTLDHPDPPVWAVVVVAVALAAGYATGGRPIARTVGERLVTLDAPAALAAQTATAGALHVSALILGQPVSTSLSVTSAVVGAGAATSLRRVRWHVVRRVLVAWVVTVPASALLAAVVVVVLDLLAGA